MAATPTIIARQGDTVDQIAARCYGGDTAMAVAILEANPGLSAMGPVIPQGTEIRLPSARPATTKTVSLWD